MPDAGADDVRITELRVEGLRTLADVRLKLDGLAVLVGDAGSGKSSVIEACELLRRAASPGFADDLARVHGGLAALLRVGAPRLRLAARMEGGGDALEYVLSVVPSPTGGVIEAETLRGKHPKRVIEAGAGPFAMVYLTRSAGKADVAPDGGGGGPRAVRVEGLEPALAACGADPPSVAVARVLVCLRGIEVRQPWDVAPSWVGRATGRPSPLRASTPAEPVSTLAQLAGNLAGAFYALKNEHDEAHWRETMAVVQLGLGADVESVSARLDPAGGRLGLWVKHACFERPLAAAALSDGTLAYLAFVALARLAPAGSLLAFDGPEAYLHPTALARVLGYLEALAQRRPVLVATHTDRLLDGLRDPARAVVVCDLDAQRATRLVRSDAAALARWLQRDRGGEAARGANPAASVIVRPDGA